MTNAVALKMERYRYMGSLGYDVIDSVSALLALNSARMITGNTSLNRLEKWENYRWVPLNKDQMILGRDGKANLMGAYGSSSMRAVRKAMKQTVDA